jgi:hypothetical protein
MCSRLKYMCNQNPLQVQQVSGTNSDKTAAQVNSNMELRMFLNTLIMFLTISTKVVYYILSAFGITNATFTLFVQDIFTYVTPIVLIAFSDTIRVMLLCSFKCKTYSQVY